VDTYLLLMYSTTAMAIRIATVTTAKLIGGETSGETAVAVAVTDGVIPGCVTSGSAAGIVSPFVPIMAKCEKPSVVASKWVYALSLFVSLVSSSAHLPPFHLSIFISLPARLLFCIQEFSTLNLITAFFMRFVPAMMFRFLYTIPDGAAVTTFAVPLRTSILRGISFSFSLPVTTICSTPCSGTSKLYVTGALAMRAFSCLSAFSIFSYGSSVVTPPPPPPPPEEGGCGVITAPAGTTVAVAMPITPSLAAVIVVMPSAFAVNTPALIIPTVVLLLLQVTVAAIGL